MNKKKNKIYVFLGFIFFVLLLFTNIHAQANTTRDVDFNVEAVLPSNQLNSSVTYFDLRMNPGEQQTIEVIISNMSDSSIDLSLTTVTASTNKNGIIDYSTVGIKDSSMDYFFSDIVIPEEDILTISANSSEIAKFQIEMPDILFNGVLLGGIVLQKIENSSSSSDGSGNLKQNGINNRYNYVIGVQLSETDEKVVPNLEVELVDSSVENQQLIITSTIHNKSSVILKDMVVTSTIIESGGNKVLLKESMRKIDMAPNSLFYCSFNYADSTLSNGNYVNIVNIKWEDQEWDFEIPFKLVNSDLSKANTALVSKSESFEIKKLYKSLFFLCLIVILILGIVFIIQIKKFPK